MVDFLLFSATIEGMETLSRNGGYKCGSKQMMYWFCRETQPQTVAVSYTHLITMNMEAEGESIDIAYFNDEEYLYMEVMGIMMKCPMPEGYFNSENFMGNTAEDLANTSNLTEELVKSVKTESVDGGTKYTITFKEDQLSKILQDENGALSEFASLANTALSGVTVDDIAESVSVNKDGYMKMCIRDRAWANCHD